MTMDLNPAMAWDRLAPPERAGDVAQRAPLHVEPLRRLELDELVVRDDDLPAAGGATLFWLEQRDDTWIAWAASINGDRAVPWLIRAARLRLERTDPSLRALLAGGVAPDVGEPRPTEPMPRSLACICREKSVEAIYRSADEGWTTVEEVKRRTGVAFGECQGRRCVGPAAARLDQLAGDRGSSITPRPPLVPVPASILAAFAAPEAAAPEAPPEG
jgi:bacterioferritin-associated ferredoxin